MLALEASELDWKELLMPTKQYGITNGNLQLYTKMHHSYIEHDSVQKGIATKTSTPSLPMRYQTMIFWLADFLVKTILWLQPLVVREGLKETKVYSGGRYTVF